MFKAKIMVVEDESIVALDIQSRLISLGYAVPVIASSGEQAIRKAERTGLDLVLMDIKLRGGMDGIEAAEQIRARFNIPVVYLTAYADGATLERAKVTEPFGYLLKPFEERELHTTIEMALYKHRMEQRLRESERWLAATLESIGDAVIATDAQGRIKFMNRTAESLTGWRRREAVGQDANAVFRILDAETQDPLENPVVQALEKERTVHLENHALLINKDGTERSIDDSAAPIRDDDGNISGGVLVFRDVTERVRAEQALQHHALQLQARNEELDAFAHTVAHDLKSPLSLIVGYAEVLREDYATLLGEELHDHLGAIARHGRKANNIVDALLLLSQVREAEVVMWPLDMGHIVTEARERLTDLIEDHRAEITLPTDWPVALGYAPWVEEVWVNYLSNGIKYGGQPPRLELGAAAQPNGMINLWVKDNGPGITPEDQARLFAPFTQLDQLRIKGHGLGLSIVRRIVEKLGGQVGVESQVDRGSVFAFTLPSA